MAVGKFYYEALILMLDGELHALGKQRDDEVSQSVGHFLRPYGIEPDSRRFSAALRSLRTAEKQDNDEKRLTILRHRFLEFSSLGDL